jgi:hypothetical protein
MDAQLDASNGWPRLARWRVIPLACWLLGLAVAFAFLLNYQSTAGAPGSPKTAWPGEVSLERSLTSHTLLMFAHPRCPCTRASLRELAVIQGQCPDIKRARVIFFRPRRGGEEWTNSDLVRQAQAMTGVEVCWDEDGILARQFGIETSGHVLLYDAQGHLAFSGGITLLRSHEGSNAGRAAVMAKVQGRACDQSLAPVFGCPLEDPALARVGEASEVLP